MGCLSPVVDDDSDLPDEERALLERARALIPLLAERAPSATAARQLPAETIAEYRDAGILRILQPRRFGGRRWPPTAVCCSPTTLSEPGQRTPRVGMDRSKDSLARHGLGCLERPRAHAPPRSQIWDPLSYVSYQAARSRSVTVAGRLRLIGCLSTPDTAWSRPQPSVTLAFDDTLIRGNACPNTMSSRTNSGSRIS